MIVVDASVVANALADDGETGARARARIFSDPDLHAPHLMDLEVLAVLRRRLRARWLDERRVESARGSLDSLGVTRYPHTALAARIWDLRENLSVYDAAYVALAEALGCSLVTADRQLARAPGLQCEIEVLQ